MHGDAPPQILAVLNSYVCEDGGSFRVDNLTFDDDQDIKLTISESDRLSRSIQMSGRE
ncbi:hypothetical protein KDW_45990 [Dictyobacter vulcani]|uniref:Uncharacterized protein n=1 Tax=Dictyobacter vulcani TaxID=2607529 RepID=A0A5J4KVA1_9CHLR|nr:hypothetical protein KDW_45990 [Dictyobacter vulcani]